MGRQANSRAYYALLAAGLTLLTLLSVHGLGKNDRLPALPPSLTETITFINPFKNDRTATTWFIGTVVRASDFQRRHIIRSTWQRLYANDARQTTRFFISNPGPLWHDMVEAENATYGDIVALNHLDETAQVANTVKSIEMLKYIARNGGGARWDFVSKSDDDSFIEADAFHQIYLQPLLDGPTPVEATIIARTVGPNANYDFKYPGGQFYTISWDLVTRLADLHDANPLPYGHEDALLGGLLREAGVNYTHIDLPNEVAFDYDASQARSQDSAWATQDADLTTWVHAVGPGTVNPHKMKTDEDYLRVAACFDRKGLRMPDYVLSEALLSIEKEMGVDAEELEGTLKRAMKRGQQRRSQPQGHAQERVAQERLVERGNGPEEDEEEPKLEPQYRQQKLLRPKEDAGSPLGWRWTSQY